MSNNTVAQAGTLESNDILIRLSRSDSGENVVNLKSIVLRQFGPAIEKTIRQCLDDFALTAMQVDADDRGALECTIKARMEAAAERFGRMSK